MTLSYTELLDAVSRDAVGVRARIALEPLGGSGDKVFPPTYAIDGRSETAYATERRRVDGQEIDAVVLDSVASQANRMELALLAAARRGDLRVPIVSVDFAEHAQLGLDRVSSLEAPHRIFDAILRDSTLDGTLFRHSEVGQQVTEASPRNAGALYRYAPHTLVFGGWDSTGPRGGRGAKYERTLTSEIVALGVTRGVKTASRIDPLAIERRAATIYEPADPSRGSWSQLPEEAALDDRGRPKLKGADDSSGSGREKGRPSQINHGNVAPTIDSRAGGITADTICATTVLSFIQLRRIGFPTTTSGKPIEHARRDSVEAAGRTALAALGLTAIVLAFEEGFDLRSRCVLHATDDLRFELVPRGGGTARDFALDSSAALELLATASASAAEQGLEWIDEELLLRPLDNLVDLVRSSQEVAATTTAS